MKTRLMSIIIMAALFLRACGTSATLNPTSPTAAVQSDAVGITIRGFNFDPATITIPVGTTVTWTNQDKADS